MSNEKKFLLSNMNRKTVYFAGVSESMRSYRENLIKELENHGCIIKVAPDAISDIEQAHEIIDQCECAVHLLSDEDKIINSIGRGYEEQQIIYSIQYFLSQKLLAASSESGFSIFAWHPKSRAESIFEEEKIPIHLQKIQQSEEVELIRTNFEDFKYYLLKKIEADATETVDEFYIKGDSNLSVYFIYDNVDKKVASEYTEFLRQRGFTVFTPIFSSDILEVRKSHNTCLMKFDIAIIFAEDATENWVNMKIMDILKSPGLGREKPILGKAVVISEQYAKMLTLISRGFELIPLDQDSPKDQIIDFLIKIDSKSV